ncbi:MAG: hypothetical protein IPI39_26405 [Candidatus Obscuribacter sp.]|nr:hypothetical protein [Candidatus Obscuribacter sp.]
MKNAESNATINHEAGRPVGVRPITPQGGLMPLAPQGDLPAKCKLI